MPGKAEPAPVNELRKPAGSELIVFVHIPKAGGTSMTRVLESIYGDKLLVAHPLQGWPQEWPKETTDLIARNRHYYAAFSGHSAFGIHQLFGREASYFTTVREPISRLESYYNFVKRWPIHHHYHQALKLEIADFFEWMCDRNDIETGDLQCLLIAGKKDFPNARDVLRKHFDFAIPMPRLAEAMPILASRYNWPFVPEAPRENTTSHESQISSLPAPLIRKLEALNRQDRALYEYCEQRWAEIVAG